MATNSTPRNRKPDQLRIPHTELPFECQNAGAPAELRPHQVSLIDKIEAAVLAGDRRIVGQAPTGFGKTIIGATLTRKAIERDTRVIFTVPALDLIDQTVEKFAAEGIHDVGVIQAQHHMTDWSRPVQIASVQTLMRRGAPAADFVLVDEAHRTFDFYKKWMNDPKWSAVPFVGLTATPWTRGLGRLWKTMIVGSTTAELIDAGYLSKFRVFAPASPNLADVRTVAGDYHEGDLGVAMNKDALVADVVDTWLVRGQGRPTLCFAVDRAHAKHIQKEFQATGITAGYVDAYTPLAERRTIAKEFHRGEIKVVCNVGCLTTGIDWDVRCIILARPTKSEILFVQMIGRGLRTADGKDDCLILDHSDTHVRLGFVTDIHHDELDDGNPRPKAEPKDAAALPKKCPSCTFLKPPKMLVCPSCGFTPQPKSNVVHQDGELVEFRARQSQASIARDEQARFYQELKHFAGTKNYKSGWVAYKFKEKFGLWPNGFEHLPPILPTPATYSWIKSRQIAFARAYAP